MIILRFEGLLLMKAAVQASAADISSWSGCFTLEAAVRLILTKWSARDPLRSFKERTECQRTRVQSDRKNPVESCVRRGRGDSLFDPSGLRDRRLVGWNWRSEARAARACWTRNRFRRLPGRIGVRPRIEPDTRRICPSPRETIRARSRRGRCGEIPGPSRSSNDIQSALYFRLELWARCKKPTDLLSLAIRRCVWS